jgi:hypothetical protein
VEAMNDDQGCCSASLEVPEARFSRVDMYVVITPASSRSIVGVDAFAKFFAFFGDVGFAA